MRKIQRAIFFSHSGNFDAISCKKCENIAKSRQKMIPAFLVFIYMIYTQNSLLLKKTYEKFNISQVLNILKFSFKFK